MRRCDAPCRPRGPAKSAGQPHLRLPKHLAQLACIISLKHGRVAPAGAVVGPRRGRTSTVRRADTARRSARRPIRVSTRLPRPASARHVPSATSRFMSPTLRWRQGLALFEPQRSQASSLQCRPRRSDRLSPRGRGGPTQVLATESGPRGIGCRARRRPELCTGRNGGSARAEAFKQFVAALDAPAGDLAKLFKRLSH